MKWILLIGLCLLVKWQVAQSFSLSGFKEVGDSVFLKKVIRGEGQRTDPGDYVILRTVFLTGSDSVVFDSRVFNEGPVEYRIVPEEESPLITGLLALRGGDSAVIAFPARLIYTDIKPGFYQRDLWMKYHVRIYRVVDSLTLSREKELARQQRIQRESDTILQYLIEHGMRAPYKTPRGVFISWHHRGNGVSPEKGDYISLHYHGYLINGQSFDNSWQRGEPFNYVVGEMELIKGWQEVIPFLTEGDSVTVAIPSPLAYGAQGAGGAIPPNSILLFDLKLLEASNEAYQHDKDTTAIDQYLRHHGIKARTYDNGVAISIVDSGSGTSIQPGALVTLKYRARLLEGQIVEDYWEEPKKFRTNTGAVPQGLAFALKKIQVGTEALVLVPSRWAYGPEGHENVPSDAVLIYQLKVLHQE